MIHFSVFEPVISFFFRLLDFAIAAIKIVKMDIRVQEARKIIRVVSIILLFEGVFFILDILVHYNTGGLEKRGS